MRSVARLGEDELFETLAVGARPIDGGAQGSAEGGGEKVSGEVLDEVRDGAACEEADGVVGEGVAVEACEALRFEPNSTEC